MWLDHLCFTFLSLISLFSLNLFLPSGAVWYLRRVLLDTELISLGNVSLLDPAQPVRDAECLMLDGNTLANLEVSIYSSDLIPDDSGFWFQTKILRLGNTELIIISLDNFQDIDAIFQDIIDTSK
jgi:hypothetical protein